jgi:hypothetical protein
VILSHALALTELGETVLMAERSIMESSMDGYLEKYQAFMSELLSPMN